MKDRKDYIVEKAFDVFMNKGYDSASITVLQKELGISRGAMYRYFKSKEELFFEVIDRYVFELFDRFMPKVAEEITLAGLIEYLYHYNERIYQYFGKQNIETRFLNFTALIIQAAKHYPGFTEKMKILNDEYIDLWKRAIVNSITKKEICGDVDVNVLARLFSTESKNLKFIEQEFEQESKFMQKIRIWKRDREYLYSLISK